MYFEGSGRTDRNTNVGRTCGQTLLFVHTGKCKTSLVHIYVKAKENV